MESLNSQAHDPLAGFTIGVTAARRSEELISLLRRRGAAVVHAPAIRIIPLVDDVELRRVTSELIERPPDLVVVTTGIGFRGWIEAGHGWDAADDLIAALTSTRIVARGPKARGAVRQAGLCEQWSPESEASPEVVERLLADGVRDLRIAVQLHGTGSEWESDADICEALTFAGAQVIRVPVYRWESPADPRPMEQLIGMVVNAELDGVSFTSAPAVAAMLDRAKALGCVRELVAAFTDRVAAMCVGPVTAAPLRLLGVPAVHPDRYRLGALARLITDELPRRATYFTAGGHRISVSAAACRRRRDGPRRAAGRHGTATAADGDARPRRVTGRAADPAARWRRRHACGRDRRGQAEVGAGSPSRHPDRRQAGLSLGDRRGRMLILVAHGTRSPAGLQTIGELAARVTARIGPVATAFVDVLGPNPTDLLTDVSGPAIVVPAFLASGYHVHTDLPACIVDSGHHNTTVTAALGPDPVLADVMHARLGEVGWRPGDVVVMAAAGSTSPIARGELFCAAAMLAEQVGEVHLGCVATGVPRVGDVVRLLRAAGRRRVFIASYLLAPGLFHTRLHECGATAVSEPIGAHPAVVDLLISRFTNAPVAGDPAAGRQARSHPAAAWWGRLGCDPGPGVAVAARPLRIPAPVHHERSRIQDLTAR